MKHLIYLFVLIGAMASTNVYAQELVKEDNMVVEEAIDNPTIVTESYSCESEKATYSKTFFGTAGWLSVRIVNATKYPENIPSDEMETKFHFKVIMNQTEINDSYITLKKDATRTYYFDIKNFQKDPPNLAVDFFTEIGLQPWSSIVVTYEWKLFNPQGNN